jgi:UDP-glucuronate 4-epimerase
MNILITGCAGFIGYSLSFKLLKLDTNNIFGVDNLNNYYDVELKKYRVNILKKYKNFNFKKLDISNFNSLDKFVRINKIDIIINLAAQAGVRYSIQKPKAYLDSNIIGFFNILETSRINKIKHLLYASTSSVYGSSNDFPLSENSKTDTPLSFYAATKKSNELMAHAYSNIHKLPCTGLRFFTVYGPFGRPDMALFKFTDSIINKKNIEVFNNGNHTRDFTYIDDVTEFVSKAIMNIPNKEIPFEIFNVGNSKPEKLNKFIREIEKNLKIKSKRKNKDIQPGDVLKTHADISKISKKLKYKPQVSIEVGIKFFINWFREYYKR